LKKKKTFAKEFKARLSLDAVKGQKTLGKSYQQNTGSIPIRSADGKNRDAEALEA